MKTKKKSKKKNKGGRPAGPVIGILGGGGPEAGCMLHRSIVANTYATCDQEHLDVVHVSSSSLLSNTDRYDVFSSYLMAERPSTMANPGQTLGAAVHSIKAAATALRGSSATRVVLGVACNTFHAPAIWSVFSKEVHKLGGVRLVSIVDETVRHIERKMPSVKRVGLLATTSTCEARVYHAPLEARGLHVVALPNDLQAGVQDTIYNSEWGLKAGVRSRAVRRMHWYASWLVDAGCDVIVLGCTEIPLAFRRPSHHGVPLLSSTEALACALVRVVRGTCRCDE